MLDDLIWRLNWYIAVQGTSKESKALRDVETELFWIKKDLTT